MQIVAYQKFIRTSPRKLRLVADAVRLQHPTQALVELKFMPKRAARVLERVFKQAVANATNNHKIEEKGLKTKHILVEEGPRYKRFRAGARGRARMIMKRTSHVKVVLEHHPIPKPAKEEANTPKERVTIKKSK